MVRRTLSIPVDGNRICTLRELQGLRIRDLAERCRDLGHPVSYSYLGKIERGYHPSPPLLKVIADALGVEIRDLLHDEKRDEHGTAV